MDSSSYLRTGRQDRQDRKRGLATQAENANCGQEGDKWAALLFQGCRFKLRIMGEVSGCS